MTLSTNNKYLSLMEVFSYRGLSSIEKKIEHVVNKNPDLYTSTSHFKRVAIAKLLREHAGGML